MSHFGLADQLEGPGQAVCTEHTEAKDYKTGHVLKKGSGDYWSLKWFGYLWYVMHRADYQNVLLTEARRLGANLMLDARVRDIEMTAARPVVVLSSNERIEADVVVGADGLSSMVRSVVAGSDAPRPVSTGEMAYRVTITSAHIATLPPEVRAHYDKRTTRMWWGPNALSIFYIVRGGALWNLVLLCPDDLPVDVARATADTDEMRAKFTDWDSMLRELLQGIESCDKWKLRTMAELPTWVRGPSTLLGDAWQRS